MKILKSAYKRAMRIISITTIMLILASLAGCSNNAFEDKSIEYNEIYTGISSYTDTLLCNPSNMAVKFGDKTAQLSINLSESIIMAYDNYNDYGYVAYQSDDYSQATEIILTSTIGDELSLEDNELDTITKNGNVFQTIQVDEYTYMITEKTGVNYYDMGYIFVINHYNVAQQPEQLEYVSNAFNTMQLTDDYDTDIEKMDTQASRMITSIYHSLLLSENKQEVYLEIDGLGIYDITSLKEFDSVGFSYDTTNMFKLYNYNTDEVYAYITHLNNAEMGNTTEYMVQADGWNNLYYNIDKDNVGTDGYRGFGIQTSKGFYYIKLDSNAPETLEESIINMLGISQTDEYISTVFDNNESVE